MQKNIEKLIDRIRNNDPTLTFINYWDTKIKYTDVKKLAVALRYNKTLTSLSLKNCKINDASAKELSEALNFNKTLTSIDLRSNKIGDAGAKELSVAIKFNKTLTSIDLEGNNIGNAGAKDLSEAIKFNKILTSINLWANYIDDAGALEFAVAIKENKNLSFFRLCGKEIDDKFKFSCKSFNDVVGKEFVVALQYNKTLTSLKILLKNNKIETEINGLIFRNKIDSSNLKSIGCHNHFSKINEMGGTNNLISIIKSHKFLTSLDLAYNEINDTVAIDLSKGLEKNESLTSIRFSHNNIGDVGINSLSKALKNNKTLVSFYLDANKITDIGMRDLTLILEKNITLTYLDIANNQIGDQGANSLSLALAKNKALTRINLKSNKICGSGAKELNQALINNIALIWFDIQNNEIDNEIIHSIQKLIQRNQDLKDKLFFAATEGDLAQLQELIDQRIPIAGQWFNDWQKNSLIDLWEDLTYVINEKNRGYTVIQSAADEGKLEIVQLLTREVNSKTDLNSICKNVNHALRWAGCQQNRLKVVQFLIEEGDLKIHDTNDRGEKPFLLLTAYFGFLEFLIWLVKEKKIHIAASDNQGNTALLVAASKGHVEIIKFLNKSCGANINTMNNKGNTALMLAAQNGKMEAVQWLINEGHAKIDLKNKEGNTALQLATKNGKRAIVKFLIGKHTISNLNHKEELRALLELAMNYRQIGIVDYLSSFLNVIPSLNIQHLNSTSSIWQLHTNIAKAWYDYTAVSHKELSFREGDDLKVIKINKFIPTNYYQYIVLFPEYINTLKFSLAGTPGWCLAEKDGKRGLIPSWNIKKYRAEFTTQIINSYETEKSTLWHKVKVFVMQGEWDKALSCCDELLKFDIKDFNEKRSWLFKAAKYTCNPKVILYCGRYLHANEEALLVKASILEARILKKYKNYTSITLLEATKSGNINNIIEILKRDENFIYLTDEFGKNALMLAVELGYDNIVEYLIKFRMNLNLLDSAQNTALNLAAFHGKTQLIELLCKHGAYVCHQNIERNTPLINAVQGEHIGAVKLLLRKYKAIINHQNIQGDTALLIAIEKGYDEIADLLIHSGADIEIKNDEGHDALTLAIEMRRESLITKLKREFQRLKYSKQQNDETNNSTKEMAQPQDISLPSSLAPTLTENIPNLSQQRLSTQNATFFASLLQQGQTHLDLEEWSEALNCFEQILITDKYHLQALIGKGKVLEIQGDLDKAQKCYQKAVTKNKESSDSQGLKLAQKKLEKLQQSKNQQSQLQSLLQQGQNHIELEEWSEALKCFEQVLQVNKDHLQALLGKGKVLEIQGDLDKAQKCYQKAVTKNKESSDSQGLKLAQKRLLQINTKLASVRPTITDNKPAATNPAPLRFFKPAPVKLGVGFANNVPLSTYKPKSHG